MDTTPTATAATPRVLDAPGKDYVLQYERLMWDYYRYVVGLSSGFLETYLKAVALPGAFVAGLFAYFGTHAPSRDGIGPTLLLAVALAAFVLSLVGVALYLTGTFETSNAGLYERSLRELRALIRRQYPEIAPAIDIDNQRTRFQRYWMAVGFWRLMPLAIMNSGMTATGIVALVAAVRAGSSGDASLQDSPSAIALPNGLSVPGTLAI